MSNEIAATIITINLVINSFLLGMLSYLHGWPQLKKPTPNTNPHKENN